MQTLVRAGTQLRVLVSLTQAKLPSVYTLWGLTDPSRHTKAKIFHFIAENRCHAAPYFMRIYITVRLHSIKVPQHTQKA
jgi:hypothetical protein